ncbi:hypothetical protein [Streptomyces rimosus]|uniref:hypothetical protein n=1 Tax=Streptomyces rimosus TaxID=1927 RepID=UPI0037B2DC41
MREHGPQDAEPRLHVRVRHLQAPARFFGAATAYFVDDAVGAALDGWLSVLVAERAWIGEALQGNEASGLSAETGRMADRMAGRFR